MLKSWKGKRALHPIEHSLVSDSDLDLRYRCQCHLLYFLSILSIRPTNLHPAIHSVGAVFLHCLKCVIVFRFSSVLPAALAITRFSWKA